MTEHQFAKREGLFLLTKRENEVFRLLATGQSNDEIAATLFLEASTIKSHVSRILTKLGVHNRVQATIVAYDCGLVVPSGELLAASTICPVSKALSPRSPSQRAGTAIRTIRPSDATGTDPTGPSARPRVSRTARY